MQPVLHFSDMFAGGCVENVNHIVGAGGMHKAVEANIYGMHVSVSHDSQQLLLH